jgi:HD-GYP domain-containing protein (c-di-GMP phosphodiesterase class II)
MDETVVLQSRGRSSMRLSGREARTSAALTCAFAALAVPLALTAPPPALLPLAILVAAYAVAAEVEFEVGQGAAVPTQLVFVPMLVLLPPAVVPLAVAVGYVIGALVRGARTPGRALSLVGTSWYALGPALVLTLGQGRGAWLWAAAFAAQVAADTAHAVVRERLALGVPPSLSLHALVDVYLIDLLLSPIALLAAFGARPHPLAAVGVLPLVALLAYFARERRRRIDGALQLSAAYRGTALLLGDVVDADDAYTGAHSRGVVDLVVAVARRLSLPEERLRCLEFAALLHDVGKIRVPKEIINKPGPLSDAEWEVVRRHPADGEAMLRGVGGILAEAAVIVRSHHEWYDGSGYPDGLAGDEIPLEARIIAACDAFSALTTDRSYRAARPVAAALAELERCAGTQFDREVVAVITAIAAADGRGEAAADAA